MFDRSKGDTTMAAKEKITDFGEKIGGAKKDIYALKRGLRVEDVDQWTETERELYITKNEVFPKPDYRKLYEEDGVDREVLFFIKRVRDALPMTPNYQYVDYEDSCAMYEAQVNFIDFVGWFYRETQSLKGFIDCIFLINNVRKTKFKDSTYLSRKLINALCIHNEWTLREFRAELKKNQFLYSDREKKLDEYIILPFSPDIVKERTGEERVSVKVDGIIYYTDVADKAMLSLNTWQDGKYFVLSEEKCCVVAYNLPDETTAEEFALAIAEEKQSASEETKGEAKKKRKVALKPVQLRNIRPTKEDYRKGKDVTGEDIMATFGFRGGEFGNWNSQRDRQENLNMSYDAFKDLAKALGIKDEDISLGKKLAISYGARGRGLFLAHYEIDANVINLTKMRGAGCLAHEWAHALDSYLATVLKFRNNWATGYKGVTNPVAKLVNTMIWQDGEKEATEYYNNAVLLDSNFSSAGNQKGKYWKSHPEMFARAFASYVHDKLGESDYLVGQSETCGMYMDKDGNSIIVPISPQGKDRERINKAFDVLFAELKEKGILHDRN